jgi:hypothetical protein
MRLSRAEQIAASALTIYGLICIVASVAGPMPHPSFAIAAALSFCGAVHAVKP